MISHDAATDPLLPALRRMEPIPERVLYVARPGLGALPSGFGTVLLFMMPQFFSLGFLIWAIWWPAPIDMWAEAQAIGCTALLAVMLVAVGWALARRHRGFVLGVLRAPFTRITVTDRRVVWTVPWAPRPLMEISRGRVLRAVLGTVDRSGRGNAAMELIAGDPAADIDGHIHFDRLPNAAAFVAALGRG